MECLRLGVPEWGAPTAEIYITLIDRLPFADEIMFEETCVSQDKNEDSDCLALIDKIAASEEFDKLAKSSEDKRRRLKMALDPLRGR